MSEQLPVTFGHTDRSIEVGGFRVTEAAYAANTRISRHEHRFPSWTAVIAGSFAERFRVGEFHCETGALLAKPASAAHSNEYGDSGARVLIVEITDAAVETHAALCAVTESAVRIIPATTIASRIRRLRSELSGPEDARSLGVHAAILDIGLLLLRIRPRRASERAAWLRRAVDRLQTEFIHPPSLSVLAAECGVHPVYLCAAFRRAHGCSPGAYVRRLRIEYARHLLATTDDSVSRVAFASGFSDYSHLSRQFRAAIGLTPVEYRRRLSARRSS
ncbi:MAG TPA: AraC family transcriptional regulator [Gemmatimonadaceae bacterium]